MKWCKKKNARKYFAVLLAFLLVVSTFVPELAYAAEEKTKNYSEEELLLEKQRENEYESGETVQESDEGYEDSSGLTNLLTGLGIETPPLDGESKHSNPKGESESKLLKAFEKEKEIDVIIRMKDRPNLDKVYGQVKAKTNRTENITTINKHLKEKANASQIGIQKALAVLEGKGKAKKKESLWIINGLTATVTKDALDELKKRDDVAEIVLDETLSLPEVTVENNPPKLPQWSLEKILAPKVWGQYGLKGEGIVVGIMDSGVDGSHEALKQNYRGRDGNHKYSWIDLSGQNYATPNDGNGHGTHVAGTAVGGGAGEPIGVAPEAEWIAAKIFNDNGSTSLSTIHQAFQWFLAPGGDPSKAPQVVNNSWGNANTYSLEFYDDVKAWVSAGIFPSFAAGNDGPGVQTIGSPGSFPETFAVGATDIYDQTASFSSRGPVFWEHKNGETERLIKPDISAPGHNIYSAWPAKLNKGKYNTISGTSMATPHVTGAIALLYQANPKLTIDDVKETLKETVSIMPHMGTLPNDSYGSGIINIYQAVTETAFAGELKGTLKNKQGEPITGRLEINGEGLSYDVSEKGEFNFKIREGIHKISISSFGYKIYESTIEMTKGETLSVNWVLENARIYSIKGKVSDESGKAIPYAYVRVKGTPLLPLRTDEKGNFEINSIPEGMYDMQVTGEGIKGLIKELDVNENKTIELKTKLIESAFTREWGMANGNIHRNAVSANAIDLQGLKSGWAYTASGKGSILFSTPAAANDRVVLVTDRGYVVALDSTNGKEIWTVRVGNKNRSSPTIQGNTVYLSGGEDGKIYALDLESGGIKWITQVGIMTIYESPVVQDGTLFVSSNLTKDAKLTALNAETGAEIWSSPLGAATYSGPSVGDGMVYIGSYENHTIRAFRIEDGTEVWSKTLKNERITSKTVFDNGTLYFAGSNFEAGTGTLYAFDAKTGEQKWNATGIGDTQAGSPIVYEEIVIIGSATLPVLRAFDRTTGKELWNNRSVGMSLNNGSVSANGLLFYAGTNGSLSVIDVYTGERLKDFSLPDYSTSGIPLLPGQVIVPHQSGVRSYDSPGILSGVLTNEKGQPVEGMVTIVETGESITSNTDGSYELKHAPGEYTIQIYQYGKKQVTEKSTFVSGYSKTKNVELKDAQSGSISITVKDNRTKKLLENVEVTLKETPVKGNTNSSGEFFSEGIFEGTFKVSFTLTGYKNGEGEITVNPGEKADITLNLQPIDVAVLNDYKGEITRFLGANGYTAEERGWDVGEDIGSYKVLYLNGAYGTGGVQPTKEEFDALIKKAKDHDVSVIFADQWGSGYGSIEHLRDFEQNPKEIGQDYGGGEVKIQVEAEHPILKGYKAGDRINVLVNDADFAWFNQYSGRTIGKIGNTELGMVGSGIAYNAVSETSAHLLLSSHASVPWETTQGWLIGQQQILLNSLDYLYSSTFGEISGSVQNSAGEPVEASIEVLETGVKTTSDENGRFELFHDEGSFTIEVRAKGLGSKTVDVTTASGIPGIVSVTLGKSEKGILTGAITDAQSRIKLSGVKVEVKNESGEKVADTQTTTNGRYEVTGLEEEVYQLSFTKEGYIGSNQTVDLAHLDGDIDVTLRTMPSVAVVGDYTTSGQNFKAMLQQAGIPATDLQPVNLVNRMQEFDVVFFNEPSTATLTKKVFDEMMIAADKAETSLIFGDAYWSGSGINHLVLHRKDPKERGTVRNTNASAQYKILEDHPIFSGANQGDSVGILTPGASIIGYFNDYSGYPLAEIKHEGSDTSHGLGIAYKPRTSGSVELLMSGHGFNMYHSLKDYTEEGKEMLVQSVLWATDAKFPVISGSVLNENGEPLQAEVKVKDENFSTNSNGEDGGFSIAIVEGDYEVEISSYGYKTKVVQVSAVTGNKPLTISMEGADNVGTFKGIVENEKDGNAVEGAKVSIIGKPRETITSLQGQYSLTKIEPGDYIVRIEKEGFVRKDVELTITEGVNVDLNVTLKPTPTIGIIVDLTASGTNLTQYLVERGYKVENMTYKDIDKLDQVDLVFANSDYAPNMVPKKSEFEAFQKALDEKRVSVIWTGQAGGRGSIDFLNEYLDDPTTIFKGTNKSGTQGIIKEEHPITAGFEVGDVFEIPSKSRYYYGFEGYSGKTIIDFSQTITGESGSMIAYKGRTIDSLEILMANMVISQEFKPDSFDPVRERLLNNAITWALDEKPALVGELHGVVQNENGPVKGEVTIKETGKKYNADEAGQFYTGLEAGTYTVTVEAFGHQSKDFTVTIENGQTLKKSFIIQSENSGTLGGKVVDVETKQPISGASIDIVGTPAGVKTTEQGEYQITLPAGTYDVRIMATGYSPIYKTVEIIEGEAASLNLSMVVSNKVAVLANPTNEARIVPFLQANGYEVDFYPYGEFESLIENIPNFKLIIANDISYSMKEDRFKAMVNTANENEVSMIFAGQSNFGTLGNLSVAYEDPKQVLSSFAEKEIKMRVDEEHPIFRGFQQGDELSLLVNAKGATQYQVYANYSGTTVGSLGHVVKGELGSSVGYKFTSSNSVQILLSTLHVGIYGNPNDRWTDHAKQIYLNAVDFALTASQGEIKGEVKDEQGNPIADALVTIPDKNLKTTTNAEGFYRFSIGVGKYEVKVKAKGFTDQIKQVNVAEVGNSVDLHFTLEAINGSDLKGVIADKSGDAVEGAILTLIPKDDPDYKDIVVSGKDGLYTFENLLPGEYMLEVVAAGYLPKTVEVSIGKENAEYNLKLSAYEAAVLGDMNQELTKFLNEQNILAEEKDWNILGNLSKYEVIIVNTNKGTKEQVQQLINESDEHQVSLVFTSTWGLNEGSIQLLKEAEGSPELDNHGYNEGAVFVSAINEHPLFTGIEADENNQIKIHTEKSPYATFKNYKGIPLANLIVDGMDKGKSIAYEYRSKNHVHLLLSSFAVTNIIGPEHGWTKEGKQLFTNAMHWSMDTEQQLPLVPVWDNEDQKVKENQLTVTGTAELGTTINIYEKHGNKHTLLGSVKTGQDGIFSIELDVDNGAHFLKAEAQNFAGKSKTLAEMKLIVTGKPKRKDKAS
ncbi:carboxypeptidase regulatory-like domain-containing protein [Paenisporosarcina indica]|uniref:carboxypeptidase regulatory-like domain-containing protein n=1 Tax=Paenisporosarcina indica TaxID=650093 RepID=UPI00094FF125|nr:carboxypeptidase regulatory-like domain-containing protein [Paenisporosarcina indica]